MSPRIEEAVAAKLLWARGDGSPVAPREHQLAADMAALAPPALELVKAAQRQ